MTSHARHTGLAQPRRTQKAQWLPPDTVPAAGLPGVLYPAVLVCVAAAAALVWISPRDIRIGAAFAGGAMAVVALARLVLPERAAGMLGCRHRYLDAVTLAAFGLGIAIVGLLLPPPA